MNKQKILTRLRNDEDYYGEFGKKYLSNSDIENWFTEKFLTAIFVFLSTMALGTTLVYIIFISLKITGISKLLKSIKDPRIN